MAFDSQRQALSPHTPRTHPHAHTIVHLTHRCGRSHPVPSDRIASHTPHRHGVLDPSDYPNGYRFFKSRAQCARAPALVHNNYAIGQQIKKRRFVKTGLWLVNTSLTLKTLDQE